MINDRRFDKHNNKQNQRLQEVVASLQEQHQQHQPPPTSSIPREEEERQPQPRPSPSSSKAEFEALRRENAELRARLVAQEGEAGRFRKLYRAEQAERRRLFNLVQELRGNIRVLVRPRPLSFPGGAEEGLGEEEEVCMRLVPEAGEVSMAYGRKRKCFEFDHVYATAASQAEVYEQVAPIVRSVLDGYNVSLSMEPPVDWHYTHTHTHPKIKPNHTKHNLTRPACSHTGRPGMYFVKDGPPITRLSHPS